jgi:hypothetical protein
MENIVIKDGDIVEFTNNDCPEPSVMNCHNGDGPYPVTVIPKEFYLLTPMNLRIQRNPFLRFYYWLKRMGR